MEEKLRTLLSRQNRLRLDSEWYVVTVMIDASREHLYIYVKDPEVHNTKDNDESRRLIIPLENFKILVSDPLGTSSIEIDGKFFQNDCENEDVNDPKSASTNNSYYTEFKSKSSSGIMVVRGISIEKPLEGIPLKRSENSAKVNSQEELFSCAQFNRYKYFDLYKLKYTHTYSIYIYIYTV